MNKKGFTMVELLTTIVILGAISVIGIVAVTKVIDSAKNNHYTTVLKNMKVAAESYFNDNRNNLPKTVGQNNKVTVKTLVDSKYLDPIKDNNNKYCDYTESLVTVYKTAISNYKYVSTLKCNNYDNRKEAVQGDLKIDISLTKPYNDKTDKATISSSDGVRSYHYKIFKNGVLLYDSGVIDEGVRDKVTIGLDYKDQVNNGTNIRAVVSATDIYGNTKQASSSVIVENKNAPLCGPSSSIKGASTSWAKENRTVSIACKNNNDIKCKQARYSNTFSSTIKEGYITIEGDNGVSTDCKVNVYVDKTIPTCSISGNPTTWVDSNRILTVTGKDSNSGISSYSWTSSSNGFSSTKTKTTNGNNTYTAWVKDSAGNVGSCSTKVDKIDTENPTCTISANPTTATQGSVTLTANGRDSQSGVQNYSWTSSSGGFSSNRTKSVSKNGTYTAWVKDNVGRVSSCQYSVANIYHKPTKPVINLNGYSSGTWTNQTVTITVSSSSSIGIDHYEYSHNNSSWSNDMNNNAVGWSRTFNSDRTVMTVKISWDGNYNYYIRAVDKSGNVSDSSDKFTVRVDKTKPTLGYSLINDVTGAGHSSGSWSRNGLFRYLYPADGSGSGVSVTQYNSGGGWQTENNLTRYWMDQRNETVSFRVRDKAGNYSNTLTLHIMIDWTPPQYNVVRRVCGGAYGQSWKFWIEMIFTDNISGVGYRNVDWYTNSWHKSEVDYGGVVTGSDSIGTWGNFISFYHTVCDKAGNCNSWNDDGVNSNGC